MSEEKKQTPEEIANNRYTIASKYWQAFYTNAQEELGFLQGDRQWNDQIKMMRVQNGQPVMTLNRIGTYIRNLNTRNRESVLKLKASADTSITDAQVDIVNAILNKVSADSNLDTHLDSSSYYQIANGIGYLRVGADYQHTYAFDQDIYVESIADPSTVYFDPSARDFLFEDANYCFVITKMTKDEYRSSVGRGGKIDEALKFSNRLSKAISPLTQSQDTIIVAEYYRKEYKSTTLLKYANPATGEVKIVEKAEIESIPAEYLLVNEKQIDKCVITHSLFDGVEFHNTTELVGLTRIPVIPVVGEDVWLNGKREFFGAVKHAMDAQRMLNYTVSLSLEVADLQAKSPWIVDDSAINGYEDIYRNANAVNYAYLPYRKGSNPPQRNSVNTDITALMSLKTESGNDIQQIFGVFDSQLGDQSNEQSGVAINARNNAATKSTYVYKDNLLKAVKEVGKVIASIIPVYYNGRLIDVQSADGSSKRVMCNIRSTDWYKIDVNESSNDKTQKQNLNQQLMQLSQAVPTAAPVLIDTILRNSDIADVESIVARVMTLLPPEVQQMTKNGKDMSPEQLKAALAAQEMQLNQTQQQMQDMQTQLEQTQQQLSQLQADNSLAEKKLQLEQMKAQLDYDIAQKELLIKQTELEIESNLKMHEISLNEQKLQLETVGIQSDQLDI